MFYQDGTFSVVDLDIARATNHKSRNAHLATLPLATLPGFTRGMDFYGPLAFIGLSQVRDSAIFSGIPLVEKLGEERTCGIWVLDTETGETLAFLRFESGVREIFAVQVLPNMRYPELLDWNDRHMSDSYALPDRVVEVPPVKSEVT